MRGGGQARGWWLTPCRHDGSRRFGIKAKARHYYGTVSACRSRTMTPSRRMRWGDGRQQGRGERGGSASSKADSDWVCALTEQRLSGILVMEWVPCERAAQPHTTQGMLLLRFPAEKDTRYRKCSIDAWEELCYNRIVVELHRHPFEITARQPLASARVTGVPWQWVSRYITHLPRGKRHCTAHLFGSTVFIAPYLECMGVKQRFWWVISPDIGRKTPWVSV